MPTKPASKFDKLLSIVRGKKVCLATHWDCDGVSSGALIYHMIKSHIKSVATISKGDLFLIEPKDVKDNPDVIICVDIQPSLELDPEKVIYIDHHPFANPELFSFSVHDSEIQSTSLLIWKEFLQDTTNPYFIFLSLTGYFGDGGDRNKIPKKLLDSALRLIPELMQKKRSIYKDEDYYEIERYVSVLNLGKRLHWSGEVPLNILKDIESYEPLVYNQHPLVNELHEYKNELKNLYEMDVSVFDLDHIQYGIIECDKNIQGVLCARHMKDKPIMVLNKFNGNIIGSMRVPDSLDFDAGNYLGKFNNKIEGFLGGGHEKAGGFTIKAEELEHFLKLLREIR